MRMAWGERMVASPVCTQSWWESTSAAAIAQVPPGQSSPAFHTGKLHFGQFALLSNTVGNACFLPSVKLPVSPLVRSEVWGRSDCALKA